MKTPVLIFMSVTLLSSFQVSNSFAQSYYQQYFDGADTSSTSSILFSSDSTSSWQVGTPDKSIFDAASTLPNALITDTIHPYPVSDSSVVTFHIMSEAGLDWPPNGIMAIQWVQKLDFDTSDIGYVEFSVDSGDTWQNAFNNPYVYNFYGYNSLNVGDSDQGEGFTYTDSSWTNVWLCFDLSWVDEVTLGPPYLLSYRFRMNADTSINTHEGWMIDNMLAYVTGTHTVNEVKPENYMEIHPNPTTGRINITTAKENKRHVIEEILVIDVNGRVVKRFGTSPTKFFFDIGDQPPGTYIVKVRTNLRTETFQVVLQDE